MYKMYFIIYWLADNCTSTHTNLVVLLLFVIIIMDIADKKKPNMQIAVHRNYKFMEHGNR